MGIAGFTGMLGGLCLTATVLGLKPSLQKLHAETTSQRIAVFALHLFCAIAAVSLYFALPHVGLSLFATKFLQGALLFPLVSSGIEIQSYAFKLDDEATETVTGISMSLSFGAGLVIAAFSSVPMVVTASVAGLSSHLYTWYKA